MSKRTLMAFAFVVSACLSTPALTNAGIIAYEGFDYGVGTALNGLNGGTGFGDAWFQDAYDYSIVSGSLSDLNDALETSGNALQHLGLLPRARRNLGTTLGASGTTAYLSFLLRQDNVGDFLYDNHDFGGIILGGVNQPNDFGNNGLYIGRGGSGLRDEYVLGRAASPDEVSSGVKVDLGKTAWLVVRLDFLSGADRMTLFVNPTPGLPEPTIGTVRTDIDLGLFRQIAVTNGNNSVWTTDEIRLGTTWEDVGPVHAVPEPSSLVLFSGLGVAGLALAWRRKWRFGIAIR